MENETKTTDENPNENCLYGMRCPNPKCGSYEPFLIEAITCAKVYDGGAESSDLEWGEDAYCYCVKCDHEGTVRDFREDAEESRQLNLSLEAQ